MLESLKWLVTLIIGTGSLPVLGALCVLVWVLAMRLIGKSERVERLGRRPAAWLLATLEIALLVGTLLGVVGSDGPVGLAMVATVLVILPALLARSIWTADDLGRLFWQFNAGMIESDADLAADALTRRVLGFFYAISSLVGLVVVVTGAVGRLGGT